MFDGVRFFGGGNWRQCRRCWQGVVAGGVAVCRRCSGISGEVVLLVGERGHLGG